MSDSEGLGRCWIKLAEYSVLCYYLAVLLSIQRNAVFESDCLEGTEQREEDGITSFYLGYFLWWVGECIMYRFDERILGRGFLWLVSVVVFVVLVSLAGTENDEGFRLDNGLCIGEFS